MEQAWCQCGRPLDIRGYCPRHGVRIEKKSKKEKVGKYSGYSKNKEWGVNWK